MATRLRPWRRSSLDDAPQATEIQVAEPSSGRNRFMLLVPEGGFSFRLSAFPAKETAQAYVHTHASELRKGEVVAFWALDSESVPDSIATSVERPEAVVMIRNPSRPGVVQLFSFVDMEAALSFLRESVTEGLDLGLALLYWAVRVALDESSAGSDQTPVGQIPPEAPGRRLKQAISPSGSLADDAVAGRLAGEVHSGASREEEEQSPAREKRGSSPIVQILAQIHAWPGWDGLATRMVAASLLKAEAYADLRRDPQATGRAALIIGLCALTAGIGALGSGPAAAFWHSSAFLLAWAAYIGSVYLVSAWVLGGRRDSLLRFFQAAGLATSPAVLFIFGAVPSFGPLFPLAASVWVAVATAIAATSVLELDRESAFLATVTGWCSFFAISQVAPALIS